LDVFEDATELAQRDDGRSTGAQRQARAERAIKHPCRDDDRRAGVCEGADQYLLAPPPFPVVNGDLDTLRWMPRVMDQRAKCDMGRMS
jgi:hypothetical protein